MSEDRKRLIELIRVLKLPLTQAEIDEHVSKLSEEEVGELISTYEDILNYENAVSESVKFSNPKYRLDLEKQYYEKLEKAEAKYLESLEKIQEEYDKHASEVENDANSKIENPVNHYAQKVEEIEKAHDDLYSRLGKATST